MQDDVCDRWGTQTTAIDIAQQNSEVTVSPLAGGGGGGFRGLRVVVLSCRKPCFQGVSITIKHICIV